MAAASFSSALCPSFKTCFTKHSATKKVHPATLVSSFLGQRLRVSSRRSDCNDLTLFGCRAQVENATKGIAQDMSGEHLLDDLSHSISKFIGKHIQPHLPENFEALNYIPPYLHNQIESIEKVGMVLVRECLLLGFFYFCFAKVEGFCRWLCSIYFYATKAGQKPTEAEYQFSAFSALEDPMRAGLFIWETTRLLYVASPLLKLKFNLSIAGKIRGIALVVLVTWFLFKWKHFLIQRFIAQNKEEAPQLIAFDKVVSLILYYIAGTCIGEVAGFAFQSVLAIGGMSGIAIGLAAKEIVGNFLGGVYLFLTRPFVIGDEVKAKSFEGEVVEMDFLHTKVVADDNSPVLVPNQAIVNEVITNYSRAKCRRLSAGFRLQSSDIFRVHEITAKITEYLVSYPKVELAHGTKPICFLKEMGPTGLELELQCSLKEKKDAEFYKAKQEILVKVVDILTSIGASLQLMPGFMMPNPGLREVQ